MTEKSSKKKQRLARSRC